MPLPPRWTRLAPYFAANVLFGAGLFFHAFLYNFYLEDLGFTETVMGVAQAALTSGAVLALLPAGSLVDRIGASRTILWSAVLGAAGLASSAVAVTPLAIYAASLLAGLGVGTWRVALAPLLMQLAHGRTRSRAFSWNVALLVGFGGVWIAAAGAVPAWLTALAGLSELTATRGGLLIGAAGTVLSMPFYGAIRVPAPGAPPSDTTSNPTAAPSPSADPDTRLLTRRRLLLLVALIALWMSGPALVTPFFNIYFSRTFDMPVERIGVIFGLAHAVTAGVVFSSGEFAARIGPTRMLGVWMLLFAPTMFGLAVAGVLPVAVGLYLMQGFVSPATNPLIDQLLLERAAAARRGIVSSWRNAATEGSAIWGAGLGGVLLSAGSFGVLFVVAGSVGALAALALLIALVRNGGVHRTE